MESIRNRRVDPRKKPSTESLAALEQELNLAREDYAVCSQISTLKENGGWEVLVSTLKIQLQDVEDKLEDFHTLTDKGRDFLLKERQDLIRFIGTVDRAEAQMKKQEEHINDLKVQLNDKRSRVNSEIGTGV